MKAVQVTRIYQGKIVNAHFVDQDFSGGNEEALRALEQTHRLFQDAVNYHLVALAGMAEEQNVTEGGKFRERVKAIWQEHPRGVATALTLQESVCRSLQLGKVSFEEAVAAVFDGCERPDILPYVQQYVIDQTAKGASAIQQEGNSLLPRLCDAGYCGNFEFSDTGKKASEMKARLLQLLDGYQEASGLEELVVFARVMDLSWVGIKTQPGNYWDEHETRLQLQEEMGSWIQMLEGDGRLPGIRDVLARTKPDTMRRLAKNNKCNLALKRAALFFMYYPCPLSAELLREELSKRKDKSRGGGVYDYSGLEDDPLVLARGQRGYVYRGFTALPIWETQDAVMYEKRWDILAFKEALKALHGFSLKTGERQAALQAIGKEIGYIETGEGKLEQAMDDDEEPSLPVLGGDRRYELLCDLVKELKQDDDDRDYWISQRAVKGWEQLVGVWKNLIQEGKGDTASLQAAVRELQGKSVDFGAQVLFHALCEEKYRPVWQDAPPQDGYPRSQNVLRDFGILQEKRWDAARLREPVQLTAAEPQVSPRLLMYSDLTNLGAKSKGCQFLEHHAGGMRLRVAVRNRQGCWQGATIQVHYTAPRLVRDQLGLDSGRWLAGKTGAESVSWLQPMLAALGMEALPRLVRPLAVSLEINYPLKVEEEAKEEPKKDSAAPGCLLNFPATLDMAPLQQALGVAALWAGQWNGVKEEKLHLHWPGTYQGKALPWWEQESLVEKGFDVLSVDLGVRYAAAWALVHVGGTKEEENSGGAPRRFLGKAGGRDWYGRASHAGFIKLDGEKPAKKGGYGHAGVVRRATEEEKSRVVGFFKGLGLEPPSLAELDAQNILGLNKRVVKLFHRLLSRYRFYLRSLAGLADEGRQEKAIQELEEYVGRIQHEPIHGLGTALSNKEPSIVAALLAGEVSRMRRELPRLAEDVTQWILPRRKGRWVWREQQVEGKVGAGIMEPEGKEPHGKTHYCYRMGGLSVARLSLLEEWRQCLQSMNRLLSVQPGQKPLVGRASRGMAVQDPCPDIRLKIENVRTERVHEIAHAIAAQALGVRLVQPARQGKNPDGKDVFHGEYERIPGRKPVSCVVLENLGTYKTHLGHSRGENTRLMLWAHRKIVDKVTQLLQEVYGIPVVLAHASYTSKFDCMTSAPGFRADAMTQGRWQRMVERKGEARLCGVEHYGGIWGRLPEDVQLYMPSPTNSGEYFVSCVPGGEPLVRNADSNAAVNIAWRALASPQALHLLHRIRMEQGAKGIKLVQKSKREKALDKISLEIHNNTGQEKGAFAAFYGEQVSCSSVATLGGVPLCHGKEMWGRLKQRRWLLCHRLNLRILKKVGISSPGLEALVQEAEDGLPC